LKQISLDELKKGDLILVRWMDASEFRAKLAEHTGEPEVYVKDLGVFLGVSGAKKKHIIIGKDVVESKDEWGAARIPLDLVESIILIMPREDVEKMMIEVKALVRRVRIRKYVRWTP